MIWHLGGGGGVIFCSIYVKGSVVILVSSALKFCFGVYSFFIAKSCANKVSNGNEPIILCVFVVDQL